MQLWSASPTLRLVAQSLHFRTRRDYWHRHPFYELGLVLGGHCTWKLDRRSVSLQAGEALLLRPQAHHCEETAPGAEASMAWLGFELPGATPEWCHQPVPLEDDLPEIGAHFNAISREHQFTDPRSQVRIRLALQSLLLLVERRAENFRRAAPHSPRSGLNPRQRHTVESAAHYFRHNLRQTLSLAQVAAYHSLCPAHFSSLFQRHHRLSPRTFLRRERLQRASELLAGSDASLKEIAAQCGFVDAAHLCKSFKADQGETPSTFRRRTSKFLPAARAIAQT